MAMEISRMVSGELRVDNTTLELRDTDGFQAAERKVDNGGGGSGEIVSVEKIGI